VRVPFEQAVLDITGGNQRLLTTDYKTTGAIPVIDQGQAEIAGFTDDASAVCRRSGPVILFGDHTRTWKFVDFDFALGADGVKVLKPLPGFDARFVFHFLRTVRLPENLGYSRHFKFLKECSVPKPAPEVQLRIATILDKADHLRRKRQQAMRLPDELLRSIFQGMFGDPYTNAKGLPIAPLGDLVKLKSGNFLPSQEMAGQGGVLVYGGNGVNGEHDIAMFEEAKLVIGRVGAYCGAVHLTKPRSWITDNALYASEMSPLVRMEYLAFALEQANLNQYASQSGQPLVSASRLYPVALVLPPLSLQDEFLKILENSERTRAAQRKSLKAIDEMCRSLASKFFAPG
jgi:type I restriction enzyme S subunit